MAFDGAGTFLRLYSWVVDATNNVKIRADRHDDEDNNIAAGLSNCICKDGQTAITQNIPFNSRRIISLADPVNAQDAATKAYADTKLNVSGGTMSGNLTISATNPSLTLNGTTGDQELVYGQKSGKNRWSIDLGDSTAETGGNAGSNFEIYRYDDSGALLGASLQGIRSTGLMTVAGDPTAANGIATKNYTDTWINTRLPITGGTISGNLVVNSNATINGNASVGGTLTAGSFTSASIVSTGDIHIRESSNPTVFFEDVDGTQRGMVYYSRPSTCTVVQCSGVNPPLQVLFSGIVRAGMGIGTRTGLNGNYGTNSFNLNWTGSAFAIYVDDTPLGNISIVSDYRVKRDVVDLPGMWDTVKQLRPISYKYKAFGPRSYSSDDASDTLFKDDDNERWGFIAHELQDAMIPTAASGVKDQENGLQSPDTLTVIAALTKALQEAMTRIEALEAKLGGG